MTQLHLGSRALLACALVCSACTNNPVDWNALFVRESACSGQPLDSLFAGIARAANSDRSAERQVPIAARCAAATTCEAYNACRHIGAVGSCTTETSTTCIDATHSQYCRGGRLFTSDCAEQPFGNNQCVTRSTGGGGCASGTCTTSGSVCQGDVIVSCSSGAEQRTDCGALGRRCAISSSGIATCVHELAACTESRCDGNVMVRCDGGVGFERTDCRAVAGPTGTCMMSDGVPRCAAATPECTEGAGECQGAVIRICINGTWERFDCGAFDNRTCAPVGEGGTFGPSFECRAP